MTENKSFADLQWDKEGHDGEEYSLNDKNRIQMRDLLNKTGKGFCLAKWTQVTMHLGNGLTHSCHHPGAHKIPLDELKENPGALHNTKYKMERRKEMLNGKRPTECDFCWRVEDNGEISDRVLKSLPTFSSPHHDKIAQLEGDEDIFPTYVEVSFNRTCNFACAYCGPAFSSKWEQEIKNHGPYDVFNHLFNPLKPGEKHYNNNETNPYIDAFWEWFPEAYKHMHTFRITGGEPLMIKDTVKVMDFLIENPNPNLCFAINSNGCPPGQLWEKFITKVQQLIDGNCVKRFELYTSAEATGKQCEFIRDGMDWDLFVTNITDFLRRTTQTKVIFMAAFNVLSVSTFQDFLKWVLELKKEFNYTGQFEWLEKIGYTRHDEGHLPYKERRELNKKMHNRVGVDIPYLRHPQFLDATILDKKTVEKYLLPCLDFMYDNLGTGQWYSTGKFEDHEVLKLKRNVIDICSKTEMQYPSGLSSDYEIRHNRAKFAYFIKQYSDRRSKKFFTDFPEYKDFYNVCVREYLKIFSVDDKENTESELFERGRRLSGENENERAKAKVLAEETKGDV